MSCLNLSSNEDLVRDLVGYAERCSAASDQDEDLQNLHSDSISRFENEPGPAVDTLLSFTANSLPTCVILSLADCPFVVAMRLILAEAGISLSRLRNGLTDEEFPPLTSAMDRFAASPIRVAKSSRANWALAATEILQTHRPGLLVVEGLEFGGNPDETSGLDSSAVVIECAARQNSGLLLFE